MQEKIRKSGIAVIGDVIWGTHFCQFYQTKQDLIETLVPYFKAGLGNNEFCMWVTADNLTTQQARKAMSKAMPGFSSYFNKGQIEILSYDEWYLKGGSFNSQSVLDGWVDKLAQALKKGYDGLRLTGNTFWLEKKDWQSFTDYEKAVNNVIGRYKIIALCTYCLDKCSATEIVDVMLNHEFALIKREGKWGIFEDSRYKNTKEALAESESRFRLALKTVPVSVAIQDRDLHFLWAYNQRTMRPDAVLGKTDFDIFPKEDAEKLIALKGKVLATGEEINEKLWITSNGKRVFLDLFLEPIKDEEGKITGVGIATVDLTAQKLMEEALHESEEKYRTLFESMNEGFALCEMLYDKNGKPVDYKFLNVNNVFEKFLDLPRKQIIGNNIRTIVPHVKPKAIENFGKVVSTGEPLHFENYSRDLNQWFDVYAYKAGPRQFGYMVLDITERKQTEEEKQKLSDTIQQEKERLSALVNSIPDEVWFADLKKKFTLTNPSALREFGYDKVDGVEVESLAESLEVLRPDGTPRPVDEAPPLLALKGAVLKNLEEMVRTPATGELRYRQVSAAPVRDIRGNVIGSVSVVRDITERKRAEEILKGIQHTLEEAQRIAHLGSWEWNVKTGELQWSKELYTIYGVCRDSFVPTISAFAEFIHPEDRESLNNVLNQLIAGGKSVDIDFRIVRPDKTIRYLHATSEASIFDNTGKAIVYIGTTQDITEQKKAQEEVARLNRELQAISECDQAIVHADDEQTILTDVCRILHTTAGYRMVWIGSVEHDDARSVRPLVWSGDEDYLAKANITWANTERGRGPTGLAIRTGKTHFFQDFTTEPAATPWRKAALSQGYRSSIAIPLSDRKGSVFAVFTLYSTEPNYFNPSEIRLLEELANDISFGISAQRERVKRQQAEAEVSHLASFPAMNPMHVIELDMSGKVKYCNASALKTFPDLAEKGSRHVYLTGLVEMALKRSPTDSNTFTRKVEINGWYYEQVVFIAGGSQHIRIYGHDISEQEQSELLLRETSNYLNNLFDYANAPIIVWDPQFRISRFNPAFEKLTDINADQAIGKQLDILFPEKSKAESMSYINKAMYGERWDVVEIPILSKEGTVRIVLWNSATLLGVDGQKMVATIAQGQDITERKQAEEEVQKLNEILKQRASELETANKELEAFSYSVSHDLRAPLRTMEGFSQALLEESFDVLNDECKDYLKRIQDSAELMAQLIDDLLQLSRLTRTDMLLGDVNLSEIAQTIAADLKITQPKRKVEFVVTPGMVARGDERLLRVALNNLLENAWKFTGKVLETHIEFGVSEYEGKKTYFVRDNGAGFDMTYVNKIFNPFQRLHTTTEFPGTGIGLASVQRIIHRHGGRVWAEGKVGKGATFYFTLSG